MSVRGLDFKPIKPADIPEKASRRSRSRYDATIGEFMRSGAPAIEVDLEERNTHTICGQLQKAIDRCGLQGNVKAMERCKRVFVVRVTP